MLQTAKVFQSGMLLQRDKEINIWGQSTPNTVVNVEIQNQKCSTTTNQDGEWIATLEPLIASDYEVLKIWSDEDQLFYDDVAVGEVWVAGGQSNMEFWMRYEKHKKAELKEMPKNRLRFYDVPEVCYKEQIDEFDYSTQAIWRKAAENDLEYFSAVGYYFQKSIEKDLDVPVAIIGCNWGGTISRAWMNPETVKKVAPAWIENYEEQIKNLNMEEYWKKQHNNPMNNRGNMFEDAFTEFILPKTRSNEEFQEFFAKCENADMLQEYLTAMMPQSIPGSLYEHMLKTIVPYGIRGFLWYQGESDDVSGYNIYYKNMLTGLISDWRSLWNDDSLPFMIVQLPGFETWTNGVKNNYPIIRQCQQETADSVPNAYLCSISDSGEEFDIHPKNKKVVGERLALLARKYVYSENILADAPRMKTISREKNIVTIIWDNVGDGITVNGDCIDCLKVFDGEISKEYSFAVDGNKLILDVNEVDNEPLKIKFAKTSWYLVNVYNSTNIPAIPFEAEC